MKLMAMIPRPLAIALAVCACLGTAQAGDTTCGVPTPHPTKPSDLENVDSDLSLSHWAEQPAGPVTCSYGYWAAKCGDFDTANRIFDKCIAKGYAGAMIWKGLMLEDGSGVPRDPARAAALYKQAADSPDEQYGALGKLHYASALYEGNGVPRDEKLAREWFQRAADAGSTDALEFLRTGHHTGSRNQQGEGVGIPGQHADAGQLLVPEKQPTPLELPQLPALMGMALAALMAGGAGWQWRRRGLRAPLPAASTGAAP